MITTEYSTFELIHFWFYLHKLVIIIVSIIRSCFFVMIASFFQLKIFMSIKRRFLVMKILWQNFSCSRHEILLEMMVKTDDWGMYCLKLYHWKIEEIIYYLVAVEKTKEKVFENADGIRIRKKNNKKLWKKRMIRDQDNKSYRFPL